MEWMYKGAGGRIHAVRPSTAYTEYTYCGLRKTTVDYRAGAPENLSNVCANCRRAEGFQEAWVGATTPRLASAPDQSAEEKLQYILKALEESNNPELTRDHILTRYGRRFEVNITLTVSGVRQEAFDRDDAVLASEAKEFLGEALEYRAADGGVCWFPDGHPYVHPHLDEGNIVLESISVHKEGA